jgi:HK97 family phage portal protein
MDNIFAKMFSGKKSTTPLNRGLYETIFFNNGLPVNNIDNPTNQLKEGYSGNVDVFSLINRIGDVASSVPLKVYDNNGEEVTTHEVLELLDQPNEDMSGPELIKAFYIYKLSIGNSYLWKPTIEAGMNKGKTKEIWLMPSDYVEIIPGTWQEPIKEYRLRVGNYTTTFPKSDVYHGKFFNPTFNQGSWLYGLSPIKVASNIILSQNSGYKAMAAAYKNQGPPYIITGKNDEGWTEEQQELVEDRFKKKYGDPSNFRKPMLTSVPLDVKMLGLSPADLKIIESTKHGLKVLANVLGGVPVQLMNDNDASTYNNMKEARKALYTNVVIPNNKALEAGLTKWLMQPWPGYTIRFDYSGIPELQEDIKTKADAIKGLWQLTPNEVRVLLGLPTIDKPEMNEVYMPFGIAPIGANPVQANKELDNYLKSLKL